jgi:integrase
MSDLDDNILAAVAGLAGHLKSPGVIAAIDRVIDRLHALRDLAVSFHGNAAAAKEPSAQGNFNSNEKTLGTLIERYRIDEHSSYSSLRYKTREQYNHALKRLVEDCGTYRPIDLNKASIESLYVKWTNGGKTPSMGHGLVTILRTVVNFGATIAEDDDWVRVSVVLRHLHFKKDPPKVKYLTRDQAVKIIEKAHEKGLSSIALAQAFQTECDKLKQTDVIGQWVPKDELGPPTDIFHGGEKWMRGLRWNQIDENLILTHTTSWANKEIKFDLKNAPLVLRELKALNRRPADSSPVIINRRTGRPFIAATFRALWRQIADEAGIPKNVKNNTSGAKDDEAVAATGG